jgi:DNA polymerase-3 subunit alpha/error-prone DNA polymerase
MLAYLISRKHVPTKGLCILEPGLMPKENSSTQPILLIVYKISFQGGGCYLLLGNVEVDYHFPTITISKMAKCRSYLTRLF